MNKEIAQIRQDIILRDREKIKYQNESETIKNEIDDMKEECNRINKKNLELKGFIKMLKSSLLFVNKRTSEVKYSNATKNKNSGKAEKQLNFIFNHYKSYGQTNNY